MADRHARTLVPHPEFTAEVQAMVDIANQNPGGHEDKLVSALMDKITSLKSGGKSTHKLEYFDDYPDLSDCETSYVDYNYGEDKPRYRLIWRDLPPKPGQEHGRRQMIGFGERQHGAAYHIAGARLGRPVGVPLEKLAARGEPVAGRKPVMQQQQQSAPAPRNDEPQL